MTTTVSQAPSDTTGTSVEGATASWDEPEGVAPRGTLVVLVGRGETAASYSRFGRRLANDAYRVRVVEVDLQDLAGARGRVQALLHDETLPAPRVLVGSDSGATFAVHLADALPEVDAVVLAGVAVPGSVIADSSWEGELEARTACPTHRRAITEDPGFVPGSLGASLPVEWDDLGLHPLEVPTLVVHGADDLVTPPDTVLSAFRGAPHTRVHLVTEGRHDVLNDVSHRSVAATIVLFLESLKLGSATPFIVRDVSDA